MILVHRHEDWPFIVSICLKHVFSVLKIGDKFLTVHIRKVIAEVFRDFLCWEQYEACNKNDDCQSDNHNKFLIPSSFLIEICEMNVWGFVRSFEFKGCFIPFNCSLNLSASYLGKYSDCSLISLFILASNESMNWFHNRFSMLEKIHFHLHFPSNLLPKDSFSKCFSS